MALHITANPLNTTNVIVNNTTATTITLTCVFADNRYPQLCELSPLVPTVIDTSIHTTLVVAGRPPFYLTPAHPPQPHSELVDIFNSYDPILFYRIHIKCFTFVSIAVTDTYRCVRATTPPIEGSVFTIDDNNITLVDAHTYLFLPPHVRTITNLRLRGSDILADTISITDMPDIEHTMYTHPNRIQYIQAFHSTHRRRRRPVEGVPACIDMIGEVVSMPFIPWHVPSIRYIDFHHTTIPITTTDPDEEEQHTDDIHTFTTSAHVNLIESVEIPSYSSRRFPGKTTTLFALKFNIPDPQKYAFVITNKNGRMCSAYLVPNADYYTIDTHNPTLYIASDGASELTYCVTLYHYENQTPIAVHTVFTRIYPRQIPSDPLYSKAVRGLDTQLSSTSCRFYAPDTPPLGWLSNYAPISCQTPIATFSTAEVPISTCTPNQKKDALPTYQACLRH